MVDRSKKFPARFYVSASGRRPVRDWILELPFGDRHVIGKDIQKVEFGWPMGRPHCAPLGSGLWEIRSDLSSNRIARVNFCTIDGEMVLLHGFLKKSQKLLQVDIDLALQRKRELILMENQNKGRVSEETFDDFLEEEGMLGSCEDRAIKEILAEQISVTMKEQRISKTTMAERMKTSRRQLNRLLDPTIGSVNLETT